jgi:CrcB protein
MTRFLCICFAGAVGTGLRYLVNVGAGRMLGASFPWATLIVNVVGCFLMSFVAYAASKAAISPGVRLTLATGFLGGLTTYSAFNWETLAFARDGIWGLGLVNLGATLVGCMTAGALGLVVARAALGA